MRVLFVANRMPFPPYRGDKLKIFNLGKSLRENHEIHLITIAENEEDVNAVSPLKKVFHKIDYIYIPTWKSKWNVVKAIFSSKPFQIAYFQSKAFARMLKLKLESEHYDAIHVQHLRMSQFIPKEFKNKTILDLPDAFSLYWQRRYLSSNNQLIRIFNKTEYQRLELFEKEIIPTFKMALVCSKEDQRYLETIPHSCINLLQNGVDTQTFKPLLIAFEPLRILFTGNMDYAPNIDAVNYFATEIFPLILKQVPKAQFVIAGQRPVPKVQQLASGNIKVTGFIENLANEYAKAHVVVSPLRIGAGTQNKVLEALSMNIPVVTTYVGYEGLELPHNIGALPSNDAWEFAENTIKILTDIDFRNQVGETGGELIRSRFSWASIAIKLESYLLKVQKSSN